MSILVGIMKANRTIWDGISQRVEVDPDGNTLNVLPPTSRAEKYVIVESQVLEMCEIRWASESTGQNG